MFFIVIFLKGNCLKSAVEIQSAPVDIMSPFDGLLRGIRVLECFPLCDEGMEVNENVLGDDWWSMCEEMFVQQKYSEVVHAGGTPKKGNKGKGKKRTVISSGAPMSGRFVGAIFSKQYLSKLAVLKRKYRASYPLQAALIVSATSDYIDREEITDEDSTLYKLEKFLKKRKRARSTFSSRFTSVVKRVANDKSAYFCAKDVIFSWRWQVNYPVDYSALPQEKDAAIVAEHIKRLLSYSKVKDVERFVKG